MLPTLGFFKNIDCPYYSVSCDRPYCHFKHRRKGNDSPEVQNSGAPEVPTYKPTPKSQLINSRSHIPVSYVPDVVIRTKRNQIRSRSYKPNDNTPTYNPTPLSILSTTNRLNNTSAVDKYSLNDEEKGTVDASILDTPSVEYNPSKSVEQFIEAKEKSDLQNEKHQEPSTKKSSDNRHSKRHSSNHTKTKSKSSSGEKEENGKISRHKHSSSEKKSKKSSYKEKDERKHKKDSRNEKKEHIKTDKERKERKERSHHKHSKSKNKSKSKPDKSTNKTENIDEDSDDELFASVDELLDEIQRDAEESDNADMTMEEENTLEECYRIFNEYKPPEMKPKEEQQPVVILPEKSTIGKRRIAHENIDKIGTKNVYAKPKTIPNPALIMANRFKLLRAAQANNEQNNLIAELNKQGIKRACSSANENSTEKMKKLNAAVVKVTTTSKPASSFSLIDDILTGKNNNAKPRRIAPVKNVSSIQRAKEKIEELAKQKAVVALNKTPIQTISKGSARVAHIPDFNLSDLPDVLQAEKSKLPVNVRTKYLAMLADECSKLYLTKEDTYQRALNEELKCYERCSALVTYRNSAMLAVNRLRKEYQEKIADPSRESSYNKTLNYNAEFKGQKFYENIKKYVLTEQEVDLHGFPREGKTFGKAIIKNPRPVPKVNLDENHRMCSRCLKTYAVDDDGFPFYPEECLYHPLKKRTFRGESAYLCCKSSEEAGCLTSHTHVSEIINRHEVEFEGFQRTLPPEYDDDPRSFAVYALDCEMCYTTKGLELTRVTIIDSQCKTVYETLVKPLNPIIDYNTRFSGITEDQMEGTSTSILQVQANILHLCNSNTILIGHSLESDLKALKIIHSTIVDTSVLFPHKFGLPHKRALRALASEYLKKIIQNDVCGHDSAEDALTCMELVIWKVKDELKVRGIRAN